MVQIVESTYLPTGRGLENKSLREIPFAARLGSLMVSLVTERLRRLITLAIDLTTLLLIFGASALGIMANELLLRVMLQRLS